MFLNLARVALDIMKDANYHQEQNDSIKTWVKNSAIVGAIFGQVIFGTTADILGRRVIFISTCVCVIFGALASASIQNLGGFGIYSQLMIL